TPNYLAAALMWGYAVELAQLLAGERGLQGRLYCWHVRRPGCGALSSVPAAATTSEAERRAPANARGRHPRHLPMIAEERAFRSPHLGDFRHIFGGSSG